ncbi:MAG: glycosyltransferase, partial [Trichloromonadaceae bacterium]
QGVFCKLPDLKKCQACLDKNQQGFATLFASKNIIQWRALWGAAISIADEITTFSNSSLLLLSRAYPEINFNNAIVSPHKIKHSQCEPIQTEYVSTLRIGVVGHISYHKGAKVIQELSREIARRKSDIQIVVFGTLDANYDDSVVKVTGPYNHSKLPSLIIQTGVNTFLFSSICPETFSYVVQELMEMQCPIACFNLGAPPERLSLYSKGMILEEKTPSIVLDSLIEFHRKIYSRKSSREKHLNN